MREISDCTISHTESVLTWVVIPASCCRMKSGNAAPANDRMHAVAAIAEAACRM